MKRRAKEREGDEEDPQPTSSSGTKNINFFADLEQGVSTLYSTIVVTFENLVCVCVCVCVHVLYNSH